MKKISILAALVLIFTSVFGQIEEAYQLPCKDFNNWPDTLPFHWYSFSNMQCTLDQATCEGAEALGIFRNHHKRVIGRQGWGSACQLFTVNKVNRNINGALTTGQAIVQSTTLTDTSNYVYTDRGGTCHKLFYGRPDSISVWARFSFFQNDYPQAMMRVHIHGNVDYQDRPTHEPSSPQTGKIANAYCYLTNPATTPNSSGLYKSGWKRFAFKFTYWDANNNPIATPTTTNTPLPSYILANLSTNRELGVGENDSIAFDDIYCIYDKGLASFKIDGVEFDDIRNYFNNDEFSTHGSPDNSGSSWYFYQALYCYDDTNHLPVITVTPRSSLILGTTITQPTYSSPTAVITVTHNDNSTFVYKILFTNLKPNVSVSLDHANGIYTVCEGQPVTVTATTSAQNIEWTLNNTTYSTDATIHPTTSGTYTVTVSNPNGCTASANAYVTINPLPNVTITGNNTICEGKTTTLTANGAHTYSWSTGETTTSINVGTSGTYTVTGTSSQGCTNTASFAVTVNPTPNVTIDAPAYLCSGNSATLTASGANTYSWSGGTSGNTLTITSGGLYSVTGTNSYTCTATASVNVQGRTTPSVSISGPDMVCTGSSNTLTATSNPAGASFAWSTGSSDNSIVITTGGDYSVTATLSGCSSSAQKHVNSSTPPASPTVSGDARCGTGTVTLSANAGNNTCLWYESSTTQNVVDTGNTYSPTLSTPGTYTYYVCAQNSDGCVSTRVPVTATAYALPDAPTVTNIRHCGAFDYTLTASGSGTIHWYTDPNGNDITTANQHITQTTTYYAAVIDEHQCRSTLMPLTVTIDDIPGLPTVTQPDPICSNTSVNVTLNATPGANGTNIAWYNSNHNSVGSDTSYTAKNLTSSTTYYASSTNAHCESEQVPVNISINPIPAAPALSCAPRCGAGEVTLSANGQTVKWYTADNQYLGEGATYTTTISNTTVFHAAVTSQGCVSDPASVTAVIKPVYSGIIDNKTACVSYTWEGTTYNVSGDYTKTLTSSLNCDSIVTLHLTINSGYNQSFDTTVCDQFVWQGQTYTTSQSITKTLQSSSGCDSTVTYNLTVKQSTQSTQTLVICSSETPYNFLGTSISASGTYTIHIPNAAGCDSTITLNVTVNPTPNNPTITTTNPARCGAGSVTLTASSGTNGNTCRWYAGATGGSPLATSPSYNPSVTNNTTYYVSSYNTGTECESGRESVSVTVNAVPAEPQVTNAARCGSGKITLTATADNNATTCRWYSNATTTASLYTGYSYTTDTLSATRNYYVESFNETTGCKSNTRAVAVATVNTIPTAPQTTPATNCGPLTADLANYVSNYPLYRWYNSDSTFLTQNAHYNTTITATTSYLVSAYNDETTCESEKSTLTVTINLVYETQHLYDTICQFSHYQQHNISQDFNEAGIFNFTINELSSNGCDSVVILHLLVKPQITNTIIDEACTQYTWNGTVYSATGNYTQTFTAANGCDSVVTLQLTIHPAVTSSFSASACTSYTWNDMTYTTSGDHTQTLQTVHGCDSVVTLHLTIYPDVSTEFSAAQCTSYTWNNVTYTESGDYTQNFQTTHGCDSIVTLHLTIYPAKTFEFLDTACVSYTWNNETYTQSGDYTQQFTTTHSCDSTVTLHLTIHSPSNIAVTDQVCAGVPYSGFGFTATYDEAGTYTLEHSDQNIYGCDSTTTLTLTVHPVKQTEIFEGICFNGSYNFNGTLLTASGTYVDTLPTIHNCDSIITLHLTVWPEQRDTIEADVCYGESYNINGFNINNATTTGYHQIVNSDIHSCDSTTVLLLRVHMPATTQILDTICQGDTYNENGFTVNGNVPGVVNRQLNLATSFGCDSTVTLQLTVLPTYNIELTDTVCSGSPYQNYGFDTVFTQVRNHTLVYTGQTIHGCDSTATITVTVNPILRTTLNESICFNGSYNFHGTTLTTAGTYIDTLSTVKGCDSIVTLHLNVYPERRDTIFGAICLGESYTLNGFNITNATTSGYHSISGSDVHGCDSTTVLYLVVNQPTATAVTGSICLGDSYTENGFNLTPTAAGIVADTLHLQTSHGCDSTVTLTLTVRPTSTYEFSATNCTSYQWNDSIYYQSGDFVQHFNNVNGCDSAVTLHLTIHPTATYAFWDTACVSYTWAGTTYNQSGEYTKHFETIHGCDSTVTLHLTIHPTATYTFWDTACVSYTWAGTTYNQSGEYTKHFETIHGCDSTVTLHLTIHPTATYAFWDTACVSYTWAGTTYTQSGEYTKHFETIHGCDSAVTLHLTIHPTATYAFWDTACVSYIWAGTTFNQSGEYTKHFETIHGCDSTVTLHLTIHPTSTYEFSATACTSYQWNDSIYYQSGDYIQHFNNVNGCDSTVTLHLTINPSSTYEFSATSCTNYRWNNTFYYHSGDYEQHFNNIYGCDSTVTLHLTIYPTATYTFLDTACVSYTWAGTTYTQSGEYTKHFETIHGCDSAVTLLLTIHPTATYAFWDTACVSYTWDNTTYTQSGEYTKHFETIHGCDSAVTLHLTIHTPDQMSFFEHICANDHYVGHGFDTTISQPGIFTMTHQDVNMYGCDSTTTLQLTVHELDTTHISASICRGEQYTDNGFDIPTSDLEPGEHDYVRYEDVSYGCQYTLILHLTVNPLPVVNLLDTICAGTAYSAYGFDTTITTAGNYTMTHVNPSIYGCDSTTTLQLTVHPIYHTNINASICFDSSYNFNGEILTASGVYYDTLQTEHGCDSTFTLNLIVFPEKRDTLTDAICLGESYQLHGFNLTDVTTTGYHSITNPDVNGCDSTTVLFLTVNLPAATAVTGSICLGESYTENGFNLTPATAGIVTDTLHLQTSHGCDSTVTLTLTVRPTSAYEFSATACTSYQWNDSIYYQSGDFVQHFNNINGCDSTVTLHLIINSTSTHEFSATACTSYQWNDSTYFESGDYVQHFDNIYGCDSTVTLHLTINPTSTHEFSATACTSYTWNDSIYYQSNDYVQHFNNVYGCDSVVTLHLTIFPALTSEFTETACVSYTWNDSTYYQSGDHIQHFLTVNGCDSTVTLHLTIYPNLSSEFSETACISYSWNDSTYHQSGNYIQHFETVHGCDSTVTLHLTIHSPSNVAFTDEICVGVAYTGHGFDTTFAQAGTYTLTHEGTNMDGCDSTTTVTLTVHPIFETAISRSICFNSSYNFNGTILTASGIYVDTLSTIHGCDSIVTLNLTVWPERRDSLVADICLGESYYEYGFNITAPTTTGYHTVVTSDIHGCDSTTVLLLRVHEPVVTQINASICQGERYIANGFNVNGVTPGVINRTLHYETSFGCDSAVNLQLTVLPTHNIELADTVCAGVPYQEYGFDTLFTQARKYTLTHTETNRYGCDSTTTLQLTVMPIFRTEYAAAICFNESYNFNGQTLTESGIYTDILTTENGCDSVVVLRLTVRPEKQNTIVAHICKGDSYHQNGFDIDTPQESGTYDRTDPDVNGCDSTTFLQLYVHELDTTYLNAILCEGEPYTENGFDIAPLAAGEYDTLRTEDAAFGCEYTLMLHLTVNPIHQIALADTVCANEPYQQFGFDTLFTESGAYTLTNYASNVYGCDSTTTLQLTVLPTSVYEFADTACASYLWNDSTYTQSGDHIQHFTNIHGCDSVVTLHLTIYPTYATDDYLTICENELPYTYGDTVFEVGTPTSSVVDFHLSTVNGCDSIVTLHLTITNVLTYEFADAACVSYTWNDSTYFQSNDYTQHFTAANGCDSTVTLHLTIYPTVATEDYLTICENELPYTYGDTVFEVGTPASSVVDFHLSTVNGCDSTVTLHLTVNPAFATDDYLTICESELPYTYGDTIFEVGTPAYSTTTYHLSTINGCDSIVTLHLTVNPTFSIDTTVDVCDVDLPFVWNNSEYFYNGGLHEIHYTSSSNCDSVILLTINVHSSFDGDTAVTVCQGALPYSFDENHSFDQAGEYTINLLTENGCDSTWHLLLTATPNIEHTDYRIICDNELPYTYMGQQFDAAGNYDITETGDDNCLTIMHFTLIVNPTYHGYDTVTVCQEELPVIYGSTTLTTSGDYDIHFPAANTCDSLITVHFTVIPTATGIEEQYVCTSDFPVVYGGQTFTQAGVYPVTFHREGLCDSVVTFTLHEAQEYLMTETDNVCDHELPYLWRGQSFTQSGIYYDSLTSQHGCDSVYRLQLTVNETQLIVSNPIALCQGETQEWRGMTLSEEGVYRDTVISTTTGCYEIYEVTVTVHPTYLFHDTVTICSDELPYIWHGLTLNEAGFREIILQTVGSYCDSIYRLTLFVNPTYNATGSASVCDYELPYLWHGQSLTSSGTYYDTLTTVNGCDSTFAFTLTVNTSIHESVTDTVCAGELPYSWRGHQINAAGHYADTIPNAAGCQDVFELTLTVFQGNEITLTETICQGSHFDLYGFDTIATEPGTLYDQITLTNAHGCDSIVNLVLHVLPTYLFETNAETCENVPFAWHGGEFVAEGTYYDSLVSSTGCDSVYILHLTINPTYDIFVYDTAMNGHEYTYDGFVITPSDSGTYHYEMQHYSVAGCDSIVHLILYVEFNESVEHFEMLPEFSFYPNPTQAALNITGERMSRIHIYDLNGKLVLIADPDTPEQTRINVTGFATGHYVVRVILDDGKSVTGKIIVNRR